MSKIKTSRLVSLALAVTLAILLCAPALAAQKTKEQQAVEFYERGEGYRAAGDCGRAVNEFDKAIALRPHDGVVTVTTPGSSKMVKRQLVTTPGKTIEYNYYPNRGKSMCQGEKSGYENQQQVYPPYQNSQADSPPPATQQQPPPRASDPGEWGTGAPAAQAKDPHEWGTAQAQPQTQQPDPTACPACKTAFSAGAKFCVNCGAALPSPPPRDAGEWGAANAGTVAQTQGGGDGWDVDTSNLSQAAPEALPQQRMEFRGPQPIMGNYGTFMCPFTSYGTVVPWVDKAAKAKASGAIGGGVGAIAGQQIGEQMGGALGGMLAGALAKAAAKRAAEKMAINAAGGMEAIREQSDMSFNTLAEMADFLVLNFSGHKDYKTVTQALEGIYPRFLQYHANALRSAHRRY